MGKLRNVAKVWGAVLGKHPIVTGVTVVGVGSRLTDTNAVDFVMKGGRKILNFKDDENLVDQVGRSVVDNAVTPGTYDETTESVKNGLSSVKNGLSNIFGGGGSVEGAEAGQGSGLFSGLLGGISNGLKNLMGGLMNGVTGMLGGKLPMLLALPLAWLAFSRFGWLGKIGGLLLGMFAASSLFNGQQQSSNHQVAPRVEGSVQQRFEDRLKQQSQTDDSEQYTVHRH